MPWAWPSRCRCLVALGCDEAQGHHFGRPQPLADVQRLLEAECPRRLSVVGHG